MLTARYSGDIGALQRAGIRNWVNNQDGNDQQPQAPNQANERKLKEVLVHFI